MRWIVLSVWTVSALLGDVGSAGGADNGNGTYTNPPLYADCPDPDIIRVGDDFYMVSTTFVNSPGLAVLHSKDLVNWTTIGNVIDRLEGHPRYDMIGGPLYRNGVFAPSIRYHNGTFYVAVQPNGTGQGLQIYHTQDPTGVWKLNQFNATAFDPALFFDDESTPYVIWSGGFQPEIYLRRLTPNLDGFDGPRQVIHNYPGLEGTHVVQRGDYYYMFHSRPRELAMYVSRSTNLLGGWETTRAIDDRSGSGHQGAIVDLPNGEWYGFAMLDAGPIGRVTNISPINWVNDWPVWGDNNVIPGEAPKPILGQPIVVLPVSTDFDGPGLPQDHRWNHNPDDSRWSLTERPGYLRLRPTVAPDFWNARNSLTHKGWGPTSCAIATFDISQVAAGDRAGLGMLGKSLVTLAVERSTDGETKLVFSTGVESESPTTPKASASIGKAAWIQLALQMDYTSSRGRCGYSLDGECWTAIGGEFFLLWDWRTGTFQGQQYAVFCYSPEASEGYVDVDSIHFVKEPLTLLPAKCADAKSSDEGTAAVTFDSLQSPIAGPLKWKSTGVLVPPVSDEAHQIVSVKDPSVVYYNDMWHVYATTANVQGNWSMVYLSFKDWSEAANAKPYYIDNNPDLRGYHCAPQVFYFRPHKKWYLIYQSQQPQYSTTDDLSKPETWTRPENFFPSKPPGTPRLWIDYWVICDDTHAYLFFTGDNGRLYRSRTRIEDFPNGMSDPEVVIEETRETLFEGSMTYRIKGTDRYLTLVEGLSPSRYYRAYTSDRLDGKWTPIPVADTYEHPFAGISNVTFEDGVEAWTREISHGELIRDGYDETLTIDPRNLQMLYQGRDPASGGPYHSLPYQLGLLRLDNPKEVTSGGIVSD